MEKRYLSTLLKIRRNDGSQVPFSLLSGKRVVLVLEGFNPSERTEFSNERINKFFADVQDSLQTKVFNGVRVSLILSLYTLSSLSSKVLPSPPKKFWARSSQSPEQATINKVLEGMFG
ncbi:hypothetical protein POM88_027375 [Heracleum sosnowskyi]|uniref:Uncharacterized protein n=1 Tax=Heracleum sosnowskyi TaxID=360622 RepID=A0AAD8I7U8_9APIA|nr:hypothetical protein POM88_027375 [Heracleum sosnowskyi]